MKLDMRLIVVFLLVTCYKVGHVMAVTCTMPGFNLTDNGEWCFAYTSNLESWPQKSMTCRAYGATLVTLEDATKQQQLQLYLQSLGADGPSSSTSVWMGLTNSLNEDIWVNYNQGVATYLPWASNFPVTTDQYNCAYIPNGNPDYDLRNQNCLQNNVAVCQMEPM